MPETDVELAPRWRGLHRQRMPAFAAFVAAVVTAVALSGGTWARVSVGGDDAGRFDVEMEPSGQVSLANADGDERAAYEADDREPERRTLEQSVPRASSELARVLAVLVALVSLAGWFRDLTPATWALVTAAALAVLVTVVNLRDRLMSALASHAGGLELGAGDVRATTWAAVAITGAAGAALAAAVAAGPRPIRRRRESEVVGTARTVQPSVLDPPVDEPRGPLAAPRDDVG